MKAGDKAILEEVDGGLASTGMTFAKGKTVTLVKPAHNVMLNDGRMVPSWYVKPPSNMGEYYVPVACLRMISEDGYTTTTTTIINQKEENMYLIGVTITKKPSARAIEAGEVETIIVPTTEVIAYDVNSAVAQVAADNADKIKALKDQKANITVRVTAAR